MNQNYINEADALVWATHYGDEDEFNFCVSRGDDLNIQDESGRTPLIAASEEGWTHLASRLLELGADLTIADRDGNTALDHATHRDHSDLIDLLKLKGASSRDGKSPIQKQWDSVYDAFDSIDAAKRLIGMIDADKTPQTSPKH